MLRPGRIFQAFGREYAQPADYGSPKIHVHHEALSDTNGSKNFYLPTVDGVRCYGLASFDAPRNRPYEVIEVPLRRLDDFHFRDVSLIKIDVEGHEFEVIQGARKTIESSRPVMIMEITSRNKRVRRSSPNSATNPTRSLAIAWGRCPAASKALQAA